MLNVEGKLFMKLKADKLTQFFMKNKFIDCSIQKGGIPGVSGCLEHTAILSQLITEAKSRKDNLVITWLDIANAYGSLVHLLIMVALERTHVPEEVRALVASYYGDFQVRFTTENFTTTWQKVEKGIITGCTLSVILFAVTMTMLVASTKKETKGPRTKSGQQQENARLYMDDVTASTATTTQMNYLLEEINRFFSWGRLEVKPGKCRALVIEKGLVTDRNVKINNVKIMSVREKSIKYLGKEFNHTLHDRDQVDKVSVSMKEGIKKLDKCALAGRYKAWILQNMLLPRLMWPLSIYSIPQTRIEEFQRSFTSSLKKWLGLPRSLSTDMLYARSAAVQLPFKSVVEEVKVARVRSSC